MTASADFFFMAAKAGSNSFGPLTMMIWISRPRTCPPSFTCSRNDFVNESIALANTATRRTDDINSRATSTVFDPSSAVVEDVPVMLPPGRARLDTRPVPTGSPAPNMTMGNFARGLLHRRDGRRRAISTGAPERDLWGDDVVVQHHAGDLTSATFDQIHARAIPRWYHRQSADCLPRFSRNALPRCSSARRPDKPAPTRSVNSSSRRDEVLYSAATPTHRLLGGYSKYSRPASAAI
jgi:hypothetical protein